MLTKKNLLEAIADMPMDAKVEFHRSKKKLYEALHQIECNI